MSNVTKTTGIAKIAAANARWASRSSNRSSEIQNPHPPMAILSLLSSRTRHSVLRGPLREAGRRALLSPAAPTSVHSPARPVEHAPTLPSTEFSSTGHRRPSHLDWTGAGARTISSSVGMSHTQCGSTNHTLTSHKRFYWVPRPQHLPYRPGAGVATNEAQQSVNDSFEVQRRTFGSAAEPIQRNPAYSVLNPDDVSYFKSILGNNGVVQDKDRVAVANVDWMGKYKGASQLLLLPKSTNEVSKVLAYCDSRRLAVVPQGGNTGLVGGSVPVHDEVIVNLGGMDKIVSFDNVNGILTCEAGCVLENLSTFVENEGFIMPLDLGAKGSCQIGGNISTNAGGLRFIRYGSLHGNVLGLEVVLANGTILDMLTTLRKDNTGYDLKHLFVGSEGSLGIVTKVAILTPAKLPSTNVAFLSCNDYMSCQKLLLAARRSLGEIISAFEFMDRQCIDLAMTHLEGVHNPLPHSPYKFYVLIETTGSDESYDKAKLEAFLLRSMEDGLVTDGVIAQDISQASNFWRIREGISEASVKVGAVYKYDLSIPVEKLYDIVEEMRSRVGDMAEVLGYGHLGDGNLHLNILSSKYSDNILAQIEPFVYEWTAGHRGSISAEHGLGLMKAEKIHYSKSPEAVQLMASIKKLIDPNSILNPYKVLPRSVSAAGEG